MLMGSELHLLLAIFLGVGVRTSAVHSQCYPNLIHISKRSHKELDNCLSKLE